MFVPNSQIWSNPVINDNCGGTQRIEVEVELAQRKDVDAAIGQLQKLVAVEPRVLSGSTLAPVVSVADYPADGGATLRIAPDGLMPSSLILGCSRCPRLIDWRANPDVETTDWRARRGKTAHRVRREGTASAVSYPYPVGHSGRLPIGQRAAAAGRFVDFTTRCR
ncbi:hypothetical protein [Paraburkholderia sp. 40]|uniref:hypothetical protein n=1 Tax=Paraburkholderia sp. 40 TaxID=2991059 RepID=UPI003D1FBF4E